MKYRRRVNEVEAIKLSFNNVEDLKNIQDVLGEPFLNVDFSDVENPRLLVEDIHKNRKFTARFNKDYLVKSIDGKVSSPDFGQVCRKGTPLGAWWYGLCIKTMKIRSNL